MKRHPSVEPHSRLLVSTFSTILHPYPDLLAGKGVVEDLRAAKMTHKGAIVFNEVRKPHHKTYHEVKHLQKKEGDPVKRKKFGRLQRPNMKRYLY